MKKIISIMLLICFLGFSQPSFSQQKDSLRYEILLNNAMLSSVSTNIQLIDCLDLSKDNLITLSTKNTFYLLGWKGMIPFGLQSTDSISSFAYTSEGLLMAVKKNELCFLNENGKLDDLFQLPHSNMGIATGKEVMYLFDKKRGNNQYKLFVLAKGGKYKQLLMAPKPITNALEMNGQLFVAIGSGVFAFNPARNQLDMVVGLQKDILIKSMTLDTDQNILYIASKDGIYALKNNSLVFVTGDFGGGIIKYFKKGLIIFNPKTADIMRIINIDKSIVF